MPRGGRLTVATRVERDELAFWREGRRRRDLVEVRFRDTGPGIPEEARENIFVPFYTTKEKGTGLGLAICQRIVKAHAGHASRSARAQGEGAEFVVSLPGLHEEAAEREPLDALEAQRARERRRAEGRGAPPPAQAAPAAG